MTQYASILLLAFVGYVFGKNGADTCRYRALTEGGWVCGTTKHAQDGSRYVSFRGVPYAEQPLGELRFKELQPVKPWKGVRNATVEGPICPHHDVFYGKLMTPQGVSEACIHANVHVPLKALPKPGKEVKKPLPILVYIHGGGWICGSGDADLNGPEYLVSKGVIIITFNYRLDVFGFLTLNTSKVPGNNGLRDMVTLLRWVHRNARYFGGDPDQITLAGQSAGASSAHILSLSPAAKGLFKRAWLMSGTGIQSYYTASPAFSKLVTDSFLATLSLNSTDMDTVHDQLAKMPLDQINTASGVVLAKLGITSFVPVVESPLPNVTAILPEDPEALIARGIGKNVSLVIGFTSNECEANRPRLTEINLVGVYQTNPTAALSPHVVFTMPSNLTSKMAKKLDDRYFSGDVNMDKFIQLCTDEFFAYPALKLARIRAASGGAPVYLYKFGYNAKSSVFKTAFNLTYQGAGHSEDQNRILKVNSMCPRDEDLVMSDWMSDMVANFIKTGVPTAEASSWPAVCANVLRYQHILQPHQFNYQDTSNYERDMLHFYDTLADV